MSILEQNHYVIQNGTFMPQRGIEVAEWLPTYAPNLTLSWIPPENRDDSDARHFAIFDTNVNDIVVRFREDQLNVDLIGRWLDDNDSTKHDIMARLAESRRQQEANKKAIQDALIAPKLDFVHSVANSRLHTFKHGGVTFGQEKPDLAKAFEDKS